MCGRRIPRLHNFVFVPRRDLYAGKYPARWTGDERVNMDENKLIQRKAIEGFAKDVVTFGEKYKHLRRKQKPISENTRVARAATRLAEGIIETVHILYLNDNALEYLNALIKSLRKEFNRRRRDGKGK